MTDNDPQAVGVERIRELREDAEREQDAATKHGADEQVEYWLGRKAALDDVLEELDGGLEK